MGGCVGDVGGVGLVVRPVAVQFVNSGDVVVGERRGPVVVRVHHGSRTVGMRQPERVSRLVQSHREKIDVGARVPGFVVVKMHVPGDRLRVGRDRIERVCQHTPGPSNG